MRNELQPGVSKPRCPAGSNDVVDMTEGQQDVEVDGVKDRVGRVEVAEEHDEEAVVR